MVLCARAAVARLTDNYESSGDAGCPYRKVWQLLQELSSRESVGGGELETLKQLERYTGAELSAAEISSFFTAFIKSATEAETGSGLAPLTDDDPDPPPKSDYKLGPGAVLDLAPDEDVAFANPTRPNAQFDPFFQAVLRQPESDTS